MPSLTDIGYPPAGTTPFKGGETAALARMAGGQHGNRSSGRAPYCQAFRGVCACLGVGWGATQTAVLVHSCALASRDSVPFDLPPCPPPPPSLADYLADKDWVCAFEKPKGNPAAFVRPATTVLRWGLRQRRLGQVAAP